MIVKLIGMLYLISMMLFISILENSFQFSVVEKTGIIFVGVIFAGFATYLSSLCFLCVREDNKIKEIEKKLYKELGKLSIEEAEKLIESKENKLEKESKDSKIKNFYLKYVKLYVNEKEIAERIFKNILKGREIKEIKKAKKEEKKKINTYELEEDKKIKIISM